MAKQTDLEKRLDELEARQNMFFGGVVPDLSNIPNLPNVPNLTQTGATPPATTTPPAQTQPPASVNMNTTTPPNLNLEDLGKRIARQATTQALLVRH